jgi:hypothetical protein
MFSTLADPRVLQRVGVLEFVDQQMAPALLVVLQYGGIFQPQLVRAQQQFAEVDQAGAAAGVFVGLIDFHEGMRDRMVAMFDAVRTFALVLPVVDLPGGLAVRIFRVIQAQPGDHALDQPQLVVRIENLEAFGQAGLAPVSAQESMGDAVERAYGEPLGSTGDQRFQPRAHFAGGFVGEGDGENRPRRHTLGLGQPADAVGQYAGLAGAGAGQYQIVAGGCADGFALRFVERVDQVRDIHPVHCSGRKRKPPRERRFWV